MNKRLGDICTFFEPEKCGYDDHFPTLKYIGYVNYDRMNFTNEWFKLNLYTMESDKKHFYLEVVRLHKEDDIQYLLKFPNTVPKKELQQTIERYSQKSIIPSYGFGLNSLNIYNLHRLRPQSISDYKSPDITQGEWKRIRVFCGVCDDMSSFENGLVLSQIFEPVFLKQATAYYSIGEYPELSATTTKFSQSVVEFKRYTSIKVNDGYPLVMCGYYRGQSVPIDLQKCIDEYTITTMENFFTIKDSNNTGLIMMYLDIAIDNDMLTETELQQYISSLKGQVKEDFQNFLRTGLKKIQEDALNEEKEEKEQQVRQTTTENKNKQQVQQSATENKNKQQTQQSATESKKSVLNKETKKSKETMVVTKGTKGTIASKTKATKVTNAKVTNAKVTEPVVSQQTANEVPHSDESEQSVNEEIKSTEVAETADASKETTVKAEAPKETAALKPKKVPAKKVSIKNTTT